MSMTITPSVASANQLYLAEELSSFDPSVPFHVDIEDGNYVYNITFGMRTVRSIASVCKNPLHFHLNVTNPADYYDELAKLGAAAVAIPFEGCAAPMRDLDRIRDLGMSPGMAVTMKTPISALEAFIPEVEWIVLMTYGSSKGGMNGLGFREHSLERIRRLRAMMREGQHICIDGGTAERELILAHEAGADMAVLGRLLFPEMHAEGKHEGRILLPSEREKTPAQLLEYYNGLFK